MDAGIVAAIAVAVLMVGGSFLFGVILGLGTALNRVRHFRDWVASNTYGDGRAVALATLGNLISWLEGSITLHE